MSAAVTAPGHKQPGWRRIPTILLGYTHAWVISGSSSLRGTESQSQLHPPTTPASNPINGGRSEWCTMTDWQLVLSLPSNWRRTVQSDCQCSIKLGKGGMQLMPSKILTTWKVTFLLGENYGRACTILNLSRQLLLGLVHLLLLGLSDCMGCFMQNVN